MYLVVGLGNPGKKYEKTRHNIGEKTLFDFRAFASASAWRTDKKFEAQISEGLLGKEKIILAIPTTFMNNSGKAVKLLVTRYRLPINNLIVIHDDIDLPIGKIRISQKSGSAGHKGVESIIKDLKTKDFTRIRIGIQPKGGKPRKTENFVLRNFTEEEENIFKKTIGKSVSAIEMVIIHGTQRAMNEFNK